jgi:hypothetical protein
MVIDKSGTSRLVYYVKKRIAGNSFSSFSLLDPASVVQSGFVRNELLHRTNRDAENEGAAAASAAAFAQCFDRGVEGRSGSSGKNFLRFVLRRGSGERIP